MPVQSFSDPGIGPSRNTQRAVFYPSPFFDIAGTYFPDTPKALFRYCRYYYYTVGVIGSAVDIHAAYPITDLAIDNEDDKLRNKWYDIFNNQFHLKAFLVEAGKDYICLGNCFISMHIPFVRVLHCPTCNSPHPIENTTYKFTKFRFEGECKKCAVHVVFRVKDETVKNLKKVNLVRWSAENIDIDYNPITGEHVYKYNIPGEMKRYIVQGRRNIIEKIPMAFIEAVRDNLPIIFNPENIYHLKRPALAEKNMGWGEPAMIRNLKDLYYLQVLKKAREAVAHQHIVPLWVLFPQPHGELNPYEHLNLQEWRGRLEDEIKKWRQDPNYIPIMPIPLGFQFIGGTFKNLDTTPETQNLLLNILAGMNMPQEFVYGGLQYSGTSFSIRMLATLFTSYRSQVLDFVNSFFIKRLSETFSIKPVKAHFTDLKLADDIQKKTMLITLNQQNKISTATMLSEFGLDATEELKKIKEELKEGADILGKQMINQEKAKADAMMENIRGQIKAQLSQQSIATEVAQELEEQKVKIEAGLEYKINPDLFSKIFKDHGGSPYIDEETGRPFFAINPVSVPETVRSLAGALQKANDKDQKKIMSEIQTSMPMLHDLVLNQMQTIGEPGSASTIPAPLPLPGNGSTGKPLPSQKPPRRAGGSGT